MIDEIVAAGAVQSGTNENSQRPGQHRMEKVTATKYGQYALSYRLESRSLYLDLVAVTFSFLSPFPFFPF